MPAPKRPRVEPTEDWSELQLRFYWPEQGSYELIRPVVLFGFTPAERAQQTGLPARTIARKANGFDTLGMHGLFETEEAADSKRLLPAHIRRAIADLQAECPAFHLYELARICYVRFGRQPGARAAINELTILQDALVASENRYWIEQVTIQRDVATAWTARAEGRSEALALMQAAADREEATDKHPVTPGPIAPARELLGEMLLELGQPAPALAAFEHSQRAEPERFRGLFGAARAAEVAGERDKARTYYEQLLAVAAHADTERPELQQARAFLDEQ